MSRSLVWQNYSGYDEVQMPSCARIENGGVAGSEGRLGMSGSLVPDLPCACCLALQVHVGGKQDVPPP
ncbi:hypothetical protein E2C01_030437 [Portunus trituberculatus]|uniref:Uncharacterized protein n=1 Tax=Portunus trituberculatus TaxID=210409 RepID=A0A5B7EU89_PORTR|nr:hypothetical protein [Portunus trituberculatus]